MTSSEVSLKHRVGRQELEHRVLEGLKHRLLAPELVEEFARAYQEEVNRLAAEKSQSRAQDEGRLAAVERKIASMNPGDRGRPLPALDEGPHGGAGGEKAALEERLAEAPEAPVVRLHPNLAQVYRDKVAALKTALADPAIKDEAMEIIRSLIERINSRLADGTLEVLLYGELARILQFCEAGERNDKRPGHGGPGRGLSVVAGAGFEPATFRL